jgi:hypothetical protein
MTFPAADDVSNKVAFVALNAILGTLVILAALLLVGAAHLVGAGCRMEASIVSACGLFVGVAGVGLLYHLHVKAPLQAARNAELKKQFPDQPWMLNPQWAKGHIDDPQIGRVIFMIVFIIGWIGGIAFIGVVNFDQIMLELQASPSAWITAAFFTSITAGVVNVAMKVTLSWATVGNGILRLETLPGSIGGRFAAKLETRLRHRPAQGLQVDLVCLRLASRVANTSRDYDAEPIWSQTSLASPKQMRKAGQGLTIPISLQIADDLPESGSENRDGCVEWRLRVSSIGGDQPVLFEWPVPIYDLRHWNTRGAKHDGRRRPSVCSSGGRSSE